MCNPAASLHEAEKTPPEDKADTKKNIKEEAKTPAALHAIGLRAMRFMQLGFARPNVCAKARSENPHSAEAKTLQTWASFHIPFRNPQCYCGVPRAPSVNPSDAKAMAYGQGAGF